MENIAMEMCCFIRGDPPNQHPPLKIGQPIQAIL